ncbi:MAG: hypothetical protein HOO89_12300 [Ferruginibacter sp.]|nr:hypothetical protein [Ferruginibacter sp.]
MRKYILFIFLLLFIANVFGQVKPISDTFFLLKKKGLLKKLGESIYTDTISEALIFNPIKIENPFKAFTGKRIRTISIAKSGFYTIVHDTIDGKKRNLGELVVDFFHKNTLPKVIRNNLFFKEGDKVLPLLFSDNELFLRQQPFLRDARIIIQNDSLSNMVDVIVLTRDVFSIGASININNLTKGEATLRDENLFGSGNRLEFTGLYEKDRNPNNAFGANFTKRNIGNTFINWTTGFKNYSNSFNTGRQEENIVFTSLNKPLISRYNSWTGAASITVSTNKNAYSDNRFDEFLKYKILSTDLWAGFNIGFKRKKETDSEKRLRHFIGLRTFYNDFIVVPNAYKTEFNKDYGDINGFLGSYSLYKQNFYKSNFIYGFGRIEDVPEGLNATLVGGYVNKHGIKRTYIGAEFDASHMQKNKSFTTYIFRWGNFLNKNKVEDATVLFGVNKFSKIFRMNQYWRNRNFYGINFTKNLNATKLNEPLALESNYGLPYLIGPGYGADTRTTLKFESVFYNLKKFIGFRFAPFVFSDLILLKPTLLETAKTNGYTAFGGGLRLRNENLVFGTIELRGYYFPRINDGVKNWKVELISKLQFNFNSNFIRRPEFVTTN